jgi:uncharacterized membrane protein YccC
MLTISVDREDMQLRALLPQDLGGLHYAVRILLGTGLVWLLLRWIGDLNPIWAVISVIVVTEPQVNSAWKAFLARSVNTLVGCAAGLVFLLAAGSDGWVMPLGITMTVLLCTYVVRFPLAWRIGPITAALVMAAGVTDSKLSPLELALRRVGEVLLGSLVALVVSVVMYRVWRPRDAPNPDSSKGR